MIRLPREIYSAETVRNLDRRAIDDFGIPGYSLMRRAGAAALAAINRRYPGLRSVLVLCGAGNNGGDGYTVARLARAAGLDVTVVAVAEPAGLKGDAARAFEEYALAGGRPREWDPALVGRADLVVDALLGTGVRREVEGRYREIIESLNRSATPVAAMDIPSGLHPDTGRPCGAAMRASLTVTFVGLKSGLFLADGPDYCGHLAFSRLDLPDGVYRDATPAALRQHRGALFERLGRRALNSHKGDFGHVLCVGGGAGMPGAIQLTATAALRGGAGLVTVATAAEHTATLVAARPELMACGVDGAGELDALLARATAVVCGPGLGRTDWGRALLAHVLDAGLPAIFDADALTLIAERGEPFPLGPRCILTPHPGEAARLLGCTTADVQADRLAALAALCERTGSTVVLKGAGTLVSEPGAVPSLCPFGNPGMSSPGMGDVLAGLIGALVAQHLPPGEAARIGVLAHALAGDSAARRGERGMLAGDVIDELRHWLNPRH